MFSLLARLAMVFLYETKSGFSPSYLSSVASFRSTCLSLCSSHGCCSTCSAARPCRRIHLQHPLHQVAKPSKCLSILLPNRSVHSASVVAGDSSPRLLLELV
ncbi:hypothetical protein BT96DRAFT_507671 [Gymnopus androsaceus JB14]|uniref:Secreted protein n=1 Tax=Gymnopus androsaceus JB14 TaxID=1447944 RepID=A0A6A4GM72_9AGAR|nr:hypothetical protein BT96DRAFT_507671 [Gymnopus androsaceus JB14]